MGRKRTFSINPVELVIFLAVLGVFGNSIYHLVTQAKDPSLRSPASVSGASPTESGDLLLLGCAANLDHATARDEVRLGGPLCGARDVEAGRRLIKAEVINTANRARPIVYTNRGTGSFESSSIPLNSGENPIFVKFVYAGGKVVSQRLLVRRSS